MLEARNLNYAYGKTQVLSDVSLRADSGIVFVQGPNGSGKSTLLRLFATVLKAPSDSVFIQGLDVTQSANRHTVRTALGYLPQTTDATSRLRVSDWLEYGAWLRNIPKSERAGSIRAVVEEWNLRQLIGSKMRALSVGQRRRVDLARASLSRPPLLLLDEPLAALDKAHRAVAQSILRTYSQARRELTPGGRPAQWRCRQAARGPVPGEY